MSELEHLMDNNRRWAEQISRDNPDFFPTLAAQQRPDYLWIGCADSRVPANEIVGLLPGELFVHRNVANLVTHQDLNCLSVLQYAVEVLRVRHIIVCGHYGCGGVAAALGNDDHGLIDNWLRPIKEVYLRHREQVDALPEARRVDALCELNVLAQMTNVAHTTVIQRAWARGQDLTVHGWIYGLKDGRLRRLAAGISGPEQTPSVFHFLRAPGP